MEMIQMNAASEAQRIYAMKVRADALNSIEQFRAIYLDTTTTLGKNELAIYTAGRNLILSFTDARDVLDKALAIAEEAKAFAAKYQQYYTFNKQHGKKSHPAHIVLQYAPASSPICRYINAEMIEKEMH